MKEENLQQPFFDVGETEMWGRICLSGDHLSLAAQIPRRRFGGASLEGALR
jgi:hypothetical protein